MNRRQLVALALASIGLLGGGSVCRFAQGQVTALGTQSTSGTTTALNDAGVMSDAVEIQLDADHYARYLFSAGTIATTATNSFLHVERNLFDPLTGLTHPSSAVLNWPDSLNRAVRKLKAMAVMPGTSQPQQPGATRVFVAGRVPGTSGHWDVVVLSLDENLSIKWTQRFAGADDDDLPVSLSVVGELGSGTAEVAVGYTQATPSTGHDYHMEELSADDGTTIRRGVYTSPGAHEDVLAAIAFGQGGVYGVGTGYSTEDGESKVVTVVWNGLSGSTSPAAVAIANPGDGRGYSGVALATPATTSVLNVSVTGTVRQGDDASPRNYFTAGYTYATGVGLAEQWEKVYAGSAQGDDVPAAIKAMQVSTSEDGASHNFTWVTGRSQHDDTLDDDALTILYDWTNESGGGYILVTKWISRWDSGATALGIADAGVALALDPSIAGGTATGPYIYVLAKTYVPDGSGHLRLNYLYLSYDAQPAADPISQEDKPTRWATGDIRDSLPPACYYGVSDGDSFPSGMSVHNFINDFNSTTTWFMMRTGQSWGGLTAYNMLSTLEKDVTP